MTGNAFYLKIGWLSVVVGMVPGQAEWAKSLGEWLEKDCAQFYVRCAPGANPAAGYSFAILIAARTALLLPDPLHLRSVRYHQKTRSALLVEVLRPTPCEAVRQSCLSVRRVPAQNMT